jgi:hypothetical protein
MIVRQQGREISSQIRGASVSVWFSCVATGPIELQSAGLELAFWDAIYQFFKKGLKGRYERTNIDF